MVDNSTKAASRRAFLSAVAGTVATAGGITVASASHDDDDLGWYPPRAWRPGGNQTKVESSPYSWAYSSATEVEVPVLMKGDLGYESSAEWWRVDTSELTDNLLMEFDRRWGGGTTAVSVYTPEFKHLSTRNVTRGAVVPVANVDVTGLDAVLVQVASVGGITGKYRLWAWERDEKPAEK